jgi:hypothetical protein
MTETQNNRTEGVLEIRPFNNHHPKTQFTEREAEVKREEVHIQGHRQDRVTRGETTQGSRKSVWSSF